VPKPHKIKYSKDLAWLAPFVDSARHHVPLHLLNSVKSYKVPLGRLEQSDAYIKFYRQRYTITIRAYEQHGKKHIPVTIETMLLHVAHELSHLVHWKHTTAFAKLLATIFSIFTEHLDQYGIPDIQQRHTSVKTSRLA
jgi:hypothetical protein